MVLAGRNTQGRRLITPWGSRHLDVTHGIRRMEQGKPLAEASGEVLAGADIIDWFADEGRRVYGRVIPARAAGIYQLVLKEPVGPVAAFTPWNFPINQIVRKLGRAGGGLLDPRQGAGGDPGFAGRTAPRFVDAGVPPGVVGLVFGDPAEISDYLIPHPIIRKMTFTGSTAGGQAARRAGRRAHEARDDGTRRPRAGDRGRRRRPRRWP